MSDTPSLEELRYPTGKFQPEPWADDARRAELVQEIADFPARLRAAVSDMDDTRLDTPYRPEGWTVRQVVHHVVDSHLNSYVRFKLALTEDDPEILTYEESLWAELPEAKHGDVEMSLLLLEALHRRWVAFLGHMTAEDFERTLRHPEAGPMDLNTLVQMYAWHCRHHLAHVTGLREREGWD